MKNKQNFYKYCEDSLQFIPVSKLKTNLLFSLSSIIFIAFLMLGVSSITSSPQVKYNIDTEDILIVDDVQFLLSRINSLNELLESKENEFEVMKRDMDAKQQELEAKDTKINSMNELLESKQKEMIVAEEKMAALEEKGSKDAADIENLTSKVF